MCPMTEIKMLKGLRCRCGATSATILQSFLPVLPSHTTCFTLWTCRRWVPMAQPRPVTLSRSSASWSSTVQWKINSIHTSYVKDSGKTRYWNSLEKVFSLHWTQDISHPRLTSIRLCEYIPSIDVPCYIRLSFASMSTVLLMRICVLDRNGTTHEKESINFPVQSSMVLFLNLTSCERVVSRDSVDYDFYFVMIHHVQPAHDVIRITHVKYDT